MKSVYLFFVVVCVLICVVLAQESTPIVPNTSEAATPVADTTATITTETSVAVITSVAEATTTTAAATVTTTTTTTATTASATATVIAGDCLSADPFTTTDYFPNKLDLTKLDASAQFSVTYSNTYKLVHNIALDEYYVLYCTKAKPDLGTTFQAKTFIQIPVTSFAAVDTRALGYLDLLGQSNNIAYVGSVTNVTTPCGNKTPALFDVNNGNLDRSLYGLAVYPGTVSNDPKGVGLGINYGTSPLGNAQWVKYFSFFTNQEVQADRIYDSIQTDYNTYRDSINEANHISYKRNITFMNYDASTTKFNIFQDIYFKNLTADAGAVLLTPTLLQPGDPTTMKGQLQNSSLVIDFTPNQTNYNDWQKWIGYSESGISAASDLALTNYKSSGKYVNGYDAPPFERNKELWRIDLVSNQGALDYWTRGMARPDLILQDLIQAQFPDYFKSRNRVFLRDFAEGEATKTASTSSYGCNLNTWLKSASISYTNSEADAPVLGATSNKLSLGAIIGVSVAGGMVALSCLATAIVLLIRKFKHNGSQQFTRLHEETNNDFNSGALDRDPMMMMEEPHETSSGRLGGSGRGL